MQAPNRQLVVARRYVALVGKQPQLKQIDILVRTVVVLRMLNARSCTHHLYITLSDDRCIAHRVFVLQVAFKRNGHNFHIIVWVGAKAHSTLYDIIVKHPQGTKMKSIGLVPIRKTKAVTGFQPAMVGISS